MSNFTVTFPVSPFEFASTTLLPAAPSQHGNVNVPTPEPTVSDDPEVTFIGISPIVASDPMPLTDPNDIVMLDALSLS